MVIRFRCWSRTAVVRPAASAGSRVSPRRAARVGRVYLTRFSGRLRGEPKQAGFSAQRHERDGPVRIPRYILLGRSVQSDGEVMAMVPCSPRQVRRQFLRHRNSGPVGGPARRTSPSPSTGSLRGNKPGQHLPIASRRVPATSKPRQCGAEAFRPEGVVVLSRAVSLDRLLAKSRSRPCEGRPSSRPRGFAQAWVSLGSP